MLSRNHTVSARKGHTRNAGYVLNPRPHARHVDVHPSKAHRLVRPPAAPPPGALNECAARSVSSRMWTSGLSSQSHLSLTSVSRLRETQVERLVGDEAAEEQVRVVVEAIEELELVEAEQHLYIHIHMQQGKASESSE